MVPRPLFVPVLIGLLFQYGAASSPQLLPTAHTPLPSSLDEMWLVPSEAERSAKAAAVYQPLARGVKQFREGNFAAALPLLRTPSLAKTPLAGYARYHAGVTELRLGRAADARRTLEALLDTKPDGHLGIAAALAAGEAAEADKEFAAALRIYERLLENPRALSDDLLSRIGRAALGAGDKRKAAAAFTRVYYEFPLSPAATEAGAQLSALTGETPASPAERDLGRAQVLWGARRYAEAREAFSTVRGRLSGDDRALADLRVAAADFHLGRYAAARDALRPLLDRDPHRDQARYYYANALRGLGNYDEYVRLSRAIVSDFPKSPWAEEALNSLGTHYILTNDDAQAAEVFGEMLRRFPEGARAERAAWKYGWWKYKMGDYKEAARVFEQTSATFPRSDYRPSFLYWAGRAHGHLRARAQADARMQLVYTDYGNSYYGRLAEQNLRASRGLRSAEDLIVPASRPVADPAPAVDIPNERTIKLLIVAGLYDDTLNELRYAQRLTGGATTIDATMAWLYSRQGELRRGINLMRRTYPQFMTADGRELPVEIQEVIFPLTYWPSIQRHSKTHGLDPYLVAALIAQESTFDPKIKSAANAVGLMQIVPATGRRLARLAGMKRFTPAMLTDPETNLRLGTLYFSRLIKQFGGAHYALASYNAGENRIVRWKAERPGIDEDEFIDDIPFPETQNYVKRILGTAENYRMLYARGSGRPLPVTGTPPESGPAIE